MHQSAGECSSLSSEAVIEFIIHKLAALLEMTLLRNSRFKNDLSGKAILLPDGHLYFLLHISHLEMCFPLQLINDASHHVYADQPEKFNRVVENLCDSVN